MIISHTCLVCNAPFANYKASGFYSHQFQAEHDAQGDLVEITLAFLATLEEDS